MRVVVDFRKVEDWGHVLRSCLCRRRPGEDRVRLRGGCPVGLRRRSALGALCA